MHESLIAIEQLQAEVAAPQAWLTPAERADGARWRNPRRFQQWLWGRIAAKRLLMASGWAEHVLDTEIVSASRCRRPIVRLHGQPCSAVLSLSHTNDQIYAAIAQGRRLGCDVTEAGPLSPAFQQLWFGERERSWLDGNASAAAHLWAAKEAVYKALNRGEGFAPHRIELTPNTEHRYRCRYRDRSPAGDYLIQTAQRGQHVTAIALFDEETHL